MILLKAMSGRAFISVGAKVCGIKRPHFEELTAANKRKEGEEATDNTEGVNTKYLRGV